MAGSSCEQPQPLARRVPQHPRRAPQQADGSRQQVRDPTAPSAARRCQPKASWFSSRYCRASAAWCSAGRYVTGTARGLSGPAPLRWRQRAQRRAATAPGGERRRPRPAVQSQPSVHRRRCPSPPPAGISSGQLDASRAPPPRATRGSAMSRRPSRTARSDEALTSCPRPSTSAHLAPAARWSQQVAAERQPIGRIAADLVLRHRAAAARAEALLQQRVRRRRDDAPGTPAAGSPWAAAAATCCRGRRARGPARASPRRGSSARRPPALAVRARRHGTGASRRRRWPRRRAASQMPTPGSTTSRPIRCASGAQCSRSPRRCALIIRGTRKSGAAPGRASMRPALGRVGHTRQVLRGRGQRHHHAAAGLQGPREDQPFATSLQPVHRRCVLTSEIRPTPQRPAPAPVATSGRHRSSLLPPATWVCLHPWETLTDVGPFVLTNKEV